MSNLHRTALVITRRQPYIDWANLPDEESDEQVSYPEPARRTVYLVPESYYDAPIEELLDEFWRDLFEEELSAWMLDEASWPADRTRELFSAWFDVEVTDGAIDLVPDEPLTDAEVELADVSYTLQHCAWCDLELEPQAGRSVGFTMADREIFTPREGLVLSIPINEARVVTGFFTETGSEAAAAGDDLVFRACTSRCETALRKEVPAALRRLPTEGRAPGRDEA